jgi:hypothetical protein
MDGCLDQYSPPIRGFSPASCGAFQPAVQDISALRVAFPVQCRLNCSVCCTVMQRSER